MQAIGFSTVANGVGPESSSGVLEAQLNRYQIQLADWCSCPSGKTPAGKEKIQDLQNKVDNVKARLDQAKAQKQSSAGPQNQGPDPGREAGASLASPDNFQSSGTRATNTTIGGFLDVFA